MEAGGIEDCLARRSKTLTRVENWLQRAVQLSIGVAYGRGSQYTEGERGRIQKKVERWDGYLRYDINNNDGA